MTKNTCSLSCAAIALIALFCFIPLAYSAIENNEIKTVAVMNFDNNSSSKEWQWLSKGLADMLITDLSASERLVIVERERLSEIVAELQLVNTGVVDSSIADQVGRIAKVDWVLFGSYIKEGKHLKIEGHILDLKTEKIKRIEWVDGASDDVLRLEKRLVKQLLKRLDIPITEQEKRSIMYVPTDSVPAFEHYSRQLDFFDNGHWFDALLECRLAVRNDLKFIKARVRIAELYAEIDEQKHAIVEFQNLIKTIDQDMLPKTVYYKLGRLMEQEQYDYKDIAKTHMKFLEKFPEFNSHYDAAVNPPNYQTFSYTAGNLNQLNKIASNYNAALRTFERLALMKLKDGQDFEAARFYSKIVYFLHEKRMAQYGGVSWGSLKDRVWESYTPLYYRFVQENRDSNLCPPEALFYIPESGVELSNAELKEYYRYKYPTYQKQINLLAAENMEIAKIGVTVNTDTAMRANEDTSPDYIQVTFNNGYRRGYVTRKAKPNTGLQTIEFQPKKSVRFMKMYIFGRNTYPEVSIELRPFSGRSEAPRFGSFQVNIDPKTAKKILYDGKVMSSKSFACTEVAAGEHNIEVYWPNGRTSFREFNVKPGQRTNIFLSDNPILLSETRIAEPGSSTYMFTDHNGKIWLLWDQAVKDNMSMHPSNESDIFFSTTTDGINWQSPKRLPMSSSALDLSPIIQQDGLGRYWIIWISRRDLDDSKWLWIASSDNGTAWSFPRKIKLPFKDKSDINRWQGSHVPHFAFTIDRDNVFWIVVQGYLFCSRDSVKWQQVELLRTNSSGKPEHYHFGKRYYLTHDHSNRLVLLNNNNIGDDEWRIGVWRQDSNKKWNNLGSIGKGFLRAFSITESNSFGLLAAFDGNKGVFLRKIDCNDDSQSDILVDTYLRKPMHPSITVLPNGNIVYAYSCKGGIIAKLINMNNK